MDKEQEFIRLRTERIKRRKRRQYIRASVWAILMLIVIICACVFIARYNDKRAAQLPEYTVAPTQSIAVTSEPTQAPTPVPTPTPTPVPTPVIQRRGTAVPIPNDIRTSMNGLSMRQNPNITYDDLSYLTIPHYDFNYRIVEGHLVVNKKIADDVLDIFAELFDIKYPIERMELIDKYRADDFESIEYNNTSAFNYRESTDGSGRLSKHALGFAIDINPQINPYVNSNGTGAHQNAREYWSRDISKWTSDIAKAAYIGYNTQIYNIFIRHGWEWGGSWSSYRDYQHFQKVV